MSSPPPPLEISRACSLRALNSFGLPATAGTLVHIRSDADVRRVLDHPDLGRAPKLVLGGGSNIVLTRDPQAVVLRVEVMGRRLVETRNDAWIVEFGAGESWHGAVAWALDQGWPGLENLALIPGTVGGAPVQNIGAYGIELADRFESLDAVDLVTGRSVTLDARGLCLWLPRQRLQADRLWRVGGQEPGHAAAAAPASSLAAGARLPRH